MDIGALILVAGILIAYFIPYWVAVSRDCENVWMVGAINLFLGWTIIFWFAALIIACTGRKQDS